MSDLDLGWVMLDPTRSITITHVSATGYNEEYRKTTLIAVIRQVVYEEIMPQLAAYLKHFCHGFK